MSTMSCDVPGNLTQTEELGTTRTQSSMIVGVSPSCGSSWFIDAGRVNFIERPISSRYLTRDDRVEIADGLAAGEAVKSIAARIGKSHQTVCREIARRFSAGPGLGLSDSLCKCS
jgi:IS30 family transposase